jgi:hypothetical protein
VDRKAELEAATNESFQRFMAAPMTGMAMASIPGGDKQEALPLLLRAAFDAGNGCGMVNTLVAVIDSASKKQGG